MKSISMKIRPTISPKPHKIFLFQLEFHNLCYEICNTISQTILYFFSYLSINVFQNKPYQHHHIQFSFSKFSFTLSSKSLNRKHLLLSSSEKCATCDRRTIVDCWLKSIQIMPIAADIRNVACDLQ